MLEDTRCTNAGCGHLLYRHEIDADWKRYGDVLQQTRRCLVQDCECGNYRNTWERTPTRRRAQSRGIRSTA